MILNHHIRFLAVLSFSTITVIACGGGSDDPPDRSSDAGTSTNPSSSFLSSCHGDYMCTDKQGNVSGFISLTPVPDAFWCMTNDYYYFESDHSVHGSYNTTGTWSGGSTAFDVCFAVGSAPTECRHCTSTSTSSDAGLDSSVFNHCSGPTSCSDIGANGVIGSTAVGEACWHYGCYEEVVSSPSIQTICTGTPYRCAGLSAHACASTGCVWERWTWGDQ